MLQWKNSVASPKIERNGSAQSAWKAVTKVLLTRLSLRDVT